MRKLILIILLKIADGQLIPLSFENHSLINCLEEIILTFPDNAVMHFVYSDDTDEILLPNTTTQRPFMVFNLTKPIRLPTTVRSNFFIYTAASQNLRRILQQLVASPIWNESVSPRANYCVVITVNCDDAATQMAKILLEFDVARCAFASRFYCVKSGCPGRVDFPINLIARYSLEATTKKLSLNRVFLPVLQLIAEVINSSVKTVLSDNEEALVYNCTSRICLTPVEQDLYRIYDMSLPLTLSDLFWVVPKPKPISPILLLFYIFEPVSLLTILTAAGFVGIIWRLKAGQFSSSFLVVARMATLGPISSLPSSLLTGRFVFLVYTFFSLEICTLFQSRLASVLTSPQYSRGITNVYELRDSPLVILAPLKMGANSSEKKFTYPKMPKTRLAFLKVFNETDCLEKVAFEHDYATVSYKSMLHLNAKVLPYVSLFPTGSRIEVTYGTRKGHYVLAILNRLLRRLLETGIYAKIVSVVMPEGPPIGGNSLENDTLKMGHLMGVFLCWGVGMLGAAIVFASELAAGRKRFFFRM